MSRVEQLPGLDAAASALVVPLTMETEGGRVWLPEEHGDERAIVVSRNFVTPGYFRTIGLPLVSGQQLRRSRSRGRPGRGDRQRDVRQARVARKGSCRPTPRGRPQPLPFEVIGVVRDSKYRTIGEDPVPFVYVPAAQRYASTMWLLLRPTGPSMVPQIRALVA